MKSRSSRAPEKQFHVIRGGSVYLQTTQEASKMKNK